MKPFVKPSKDTETVVAALSEHVLKLPATLRRSLTWDRGHEMAKHKSFTVHTKVKVYFCDPQSPGRLFGSNCRLRSKRVQGSCNSKGHDSKPNSRMEPPDSTLPGH